MSILAFDIGGTRIKAGVVAVGEVVSMATVDTDESGGAAGILDQILSLGRRVAEGTRVEAVGVSVRGIVDPESGCLLGINPPLAFMAGAPLLTVLASEFGVPARAENDARMFALGELRHGAGQGIANLVCLTLGTGVGVAVALDGRVLRGPRGTRGILGGHFTIDVNGRRCTCGNVGCLETMVGAEPIVADATERLQSGVASSLLIEGLDPPAIFAAAAAGDSVAVGTIARFTGALAAGVVTMIHAYDPDLVVLGGGLSTSSAQFLPELCALVDENAWTLPKGRVRVEVSQLGDRAALLGAAELAAHDTWAY